MPSTKMRTFQPFNVGIARNFVDLAAVFEGRSLMHRTLQLPWRAPRKRTKLPGGEQSANQAGFLPKGLTPSVDGRPNFLRRSESGPFPKSGRLISVSSDISRTSPTVFRSAARRAFWIL